jgi:hypothetical protein
MTIANEVAPSGCACYGLNRIAAESGGKVFVYTPPEATAHKCMVYGGCLCLQRRPRSRQRDLLEGRRPAADGLDQAALRGRGGARRRSVRARRTANAWRAALSAGLLRSQPPKGGGTIAAAAERVRGGATVSAS